MEIKKVVRTPNIEINNANYLNLECTVHIFEETKFTYKFFFFFFEILRT